MAAKRKRDRLYVVGCCPVWKEVNVACCMRLTNGSSGFAGGLVVWVRLLVKFSQVMPAIIGSSRTVN